MIEAAGVIALLTDFGWGDPYAAVMKGVILSVNRHARLVDLSHDVAPQDVRGAAWLLSSAWRWFPDGTVFAAVVDPGVGGDRAILAVEGERHLFLAPDNGLLGFLREAGAARRIVRVTRRRYFLEPVSNTFHGRDIIAPVAAHLSLGVAPSELGEETDRMATLRAPSLREVKGGGVAGEVVAIDRFGNLVTNIPADRLPAPGPVRIRVGRRLVRRLDRTYAGGSEGELLALVGSGGTLEIAVNRGSAKRKTKARVGDPVIVNRKPPDTDGGS